MRDLDQLKSRRSSTVQIALAILVLPLIPIGWPYVEFNEPFDKAARFELLFYIGASGAVWLLMSIFFWVFFRVLRSRR
jgi:hypothetical protein